MFQRILVANRGEIALRVIRACHDLGVEAVAVYSEADRDAPYLELADGRICIGPPPAADSYLKHSRLISAAEAADARAIHPGYGFLSENAAFARMCRECEFEFIGPSPEAMEALGDKDQARALAQKHGVPVVPGTGILEKEAEAVAAAGAIGYPVLIKAAAGGGGRGMRVVREAGAFRSAYAAARNEAEAAFKDGRVYVEKFIDRPRHVEVQLLGDRQGNVIHLYERECSLQRRHQKLVEESPSPKLPPDVRRAMCEAAVRLARGAGYYCAGTCEFLVDQQNRFYFIEVNARIQVEHPVTELVTGIDLVREMIRVSAGEPLRFKQEDVTPRGCAIECRINAEDPANGFRPSPGQITRWVPPGGPGVRLDTHAAAGYRVPPYYDSLVAKLLVHQPTRAEAIATMRRALREFRIEGVHTTIPLHLRIMDDARFAAGDVDTGYVERELLEKS
jgi:acetyl-CoA carboxylase biotin carboxylase subunit